MTEDEAQTWRNQMERRYRLDRPAAQDVLSVLEQNIPRVIYTPGAKTTMVATTYLDTHAGDYLKIYEQSNGVDSLKLRIREYIPLADADRTPMQVRSHCYLERKERHDTVRLKQRIRLNKNQVSGILCNMDPLPSAGEESTALQHDLHAAEHVPVLVSAYERQVWGFEKDLRITFDERLRFHEPPPGFYRELDQLSPNKLDSPFALGPSRILEIKHNAIATLPAWLDSLLADLDQDIGYSKFVDGLHQKRKRPRMVRSLTRPIIWPPPS